MQNTHYTSTEFMIRNVFDGLLMPNRKQDLTHAAQLDFRLNITTDKSNYGQRHVAVGIHLLRFGHSILGAVDDDWLFPKFKADREWDRLSTHDSCWTDSTMRFMDDIIRDVMTNKNGSKYCTDDDLTFDDDNYDVFFIVNGFHYLNVDDIKDVTFIQTSGWDTFDTPKKLVPDHMLEWFKSQTV